jgi:hypothetical protein
MIVAKDLTEYELIKRARMKELQQKINVRKRFERDYNHMMETGVSLNLEGYREPDNLETFLNKQNIDSNLQRLLVSELGATIYTAKQFIQSLDVTLKERLLERFPIFKKTLEENFTKATPQTLQAAHSLLTMNILKNEQKSSLPNKNQIKDFVKKNVHETKRFQFRDILDAKSGIKSSTYLSAIDNLFESMKFIDALTWLNSIMENTFGAPDLPIITIANKSDIRSSMITEAVPAPVEIQRKKIKVPSKSGKKFVTIKKRSPFTGEPIAEEV